SLRRLRQSPRRLPTTSSLPKPSLGPVKASSAGRTDSCKKLKRKSRVHAMRT
ncbi:unnamed protein product, partial [Symbiodinium sp. CCMP2456]